MAERPILFSAPMVRAILSGTKTQTRRVVKGVFMKRDYPEVNQLLSERQDHPLRRVACPYGAPGDVLWVRETWAPCEAPIRSGFFQYAADGAIGRRVSTSGGDDFWMHNGHTIGISDPSLLGVWVGKPSKWRPSIHMPRWASRLSLRIKSVRVERLQEISEFDAVAEGVTDWITGPTSPRSDYRALWESINGAGSWDANPWVWAIEFKRQ